MKRAVVVLLLLLANALVGSNKQTSPGTFPQESTAFLRDACGAVLPSFERGDTSRDRLTHSTSRLSFPRGRSSS